MDYTWHKMWEDVAGERYTRTKAVCYENEVALMVIVGDCDEDGTYRRENTERSVCFEFNMKDKTKTLFFNKLDIKRQDNLEEETTIGMLDGERFLLKPLSQIITEERSGILYDAARSILLADVIVGEFFPGLCLHTYGGIYDWKPIPMLCVGRTYLLGKERNHRNFETLQYVNAFGAMIIDRDKTKEVSDDSVTVLFHHHMEDEKYANLPIEIKNLKLIKQGETDNIQVSYKKITGETVETNIEEMLHKNTQEEIVKVLLLTIQEMDMIVRRRFKGWCLISE